MKESAIFKWNGQTYQLVEGEEDSVVDQSLACAEWPWRT